MTTNGDQTAIVRVDPTDVSMMVPVRDLIARGEAIRDVVQKVMVENLHYGRLPGTDKPTLLKPGAEVLIKTFRLVPVPEIVSAVETVEFIAFTVRVVLRAHDGTDVAAGLGSCNSRESKYAWRQANRTCPQCRAETIIAGKAEFGGGWVCWAKKGGCGRKFDGEDKSIVEQPTGLVATNPWDFHNTVLKMAEKRALVAAVLHATAASDTFTQDLDDRDETSTIVPEPAAAPEPQRYQQGDVKADFRRMDLMAFRAECTARGVKRAIIAAVIGVPPAQLKGDLIAEWVRANKTSYEVLLKRLTGEKTAAVEVVEPMPSEPPEEVAE